MFKLDIFAQMKLATFLFCLVIIFGSCKKRNLGLEESGALTFSKSTVVFDTVFTGVGSATQILTVYNPHSKDILIASASIEGLANSSFRFNLDGFPGDQKDVLIPANDSLYLFVEVTVNANDKNNPFFIEDNIVFITNGQEQKIGLTAYGQNAYYYRPNRVIQGLPPFSNLSSYLPSPITSLEVNWKNDKPHVIYGYLLVDSLLTLSIEAGTQIHFHKDAGLWVYRGAALNVMGELDNEVVFQGDRLEANFDDVAGQWDRIWINTGAESTIRYAHIKNGFLGLQVEPLPFDEQQDVVEAKVLVQKTTISNMVGIGVFLRNVNFKMENSLVFNVGKYNLAVTGGGEMQFLNSTFANFWNGGTRREDPMMFLSNRYSSGDNNEEAIDLDLLFGNSIIYGANDEELELDSSLNAKFQLTFDHCVLRTELSTINSTRYLSCVVNPPNVVVGSSSFLPVFNNPSELDFSLFKQSVAVNKGSKDILNLLIDKTDIDNNSRDNLPDIGAFEFL